jgi:hypothetical protein
MQTNSPTPMIPRCIACHDLGLEYAEGGMARQCWRIKAGAAHNPQNAAAQMVERSLREMRIEKVAIDRHTFEVVRSLAEFTTENPAKRDELIGRHFTCWAGSTAIRNLHNVIEILRKVWLLPVGSRKGNHDDSPAGYWIIVTAEDFADYFNQAKAAPITQLTTLHRVAKRNFPIFAEQFELEFYNDIDDPSSLGTTAVAA